LALGKERWSLYLKRGRMKPAHELEGYRSVTCNPALELRIAPILDADRGVVVAVDCRYFRHDRGRSLQTSAGFRLPCHAVRQVAAALHAMANELGLPDQRSGAA
jgi:hypothetical protein